MMLGSGPYATQLVDAIVQQNGFKLAAVLSLNDSRTQSAGDSRHTIDWHKLRKLDGVPYLRDLAEAHCTAICTTDSTEALQQHMQVSRTLRQALAEDETATWLARPMRRIAQNVHAAALTADATQRSGADQGPLEACGGELVALFSVAKRMKDDEMKQAALSIAITLFRIYVALNNPQLSRQLIGAIQAPAFQPFSKFPASLRVTYMYYLGRMAILDDQLEDADKYLDYAFQHCLKSAQPNIRRILYFLMPVKMIQGLLPSPRLLQELNLPIYNGIAEAMRTGNVRQYNEAMSQHQWTFIQMGLFLVLDKLRYPIYRRLFRRVHAVHAHTCEPGKGHILPLGLYHHALRWLQDTWCQDYSECECLVCNLIAKGWIKGYISHSQGVVVLSKQSPFPEVSQLQIAA